MKEQSVIHSTFVIERRYSASVERVFDAFADPAKKRRWFIESGGNEVDQYEMDFRVGGRECARFHFANNGTPVAGMACTNDTGYLEIAPNRYLVFASSMTIESKCISAGLHTVELLPSGTGTELIFTHQGAFFEGSDGPERRERGWRYLLDRLAEELDAARKT